MTRLQRVAIFGASGNFGAPITSALVASGFDVTIITRKSSSSTFPPGIPVIKTEYTLENLTNALKDHDAVICAVGMGGIATQEIMIDAAEAAGVKRFIVDDFGWGPNLRSFPEFKPIGLKRRAAWDHAKALAEAKPSFTWTGITIGNPIDWAMERFPLMGFDISTNTAIIYDSGTERFTGTTLEGIGQAAVGVLDHQEETANRFVKCRSIETCQNELLDAYQCVIGQSWTVLHNTTKALIDSGRAKYQAGRGGWTLELVVAQTFDEGEARCIVASKEDSDAGLLGIREETLQEIIAKVFELRRRRN